MFNRRPLLFVLICLLCLTLGAVKADPLTSSVIAFLTAARQGDNAKIQTLIQQGVDVNAIDVNMGYDALMIAAQMNHPATVKLLLDYGAFVDSPSPYTRRNGSPLLLASDGFANILGGAKPPVLKRSGTQRPSQIEIRKPHQDLIKWRHGYYDIIQLLIDRGADVKARGIDGSTPLLHAAFGCDAQTLQLLLQHGADVNARTSDGDTSLMNAAILPWPDSSAKVKLLLAWGADISAKNKNDDTALTFVKQAHQVDVLKVLETELAKRKATVLMH